ncbi:DNA topoisomerase I [candidate division WWE3 bacterium RIFOXYC2_FULL_42_13]|nr:MAG: DNA topoisomerase I [candidate division WWE3 bacterium RIFOXYA12_FULL_43_11]OGC72963.1 MAG: DNA topoisomerase I [candidate division WWE3 bacterium RIFOXYC2_FULL_42_13]OGC75820.1 MAG: DNA topoisomerase I [candidate division WWE3 bacterium RIFOXYD2_FULL_43_10]HBY10373.1 type I DNA topoisomerase [candidate division WWE3 bacterium]
MKLVIVESPTKAKTLSKILPQSYSIKASMGHIRDLPKSGLGVDVEKDFTPVYEVPSKAKKVLTDLKKTAKEAEEVVLATDPDREGEAIAWHLEELLRGKKDTRTFSRVVFHELTKEAIDEAFKNPGKIDSDLVDAQQARRVLDRLVGYKLSPLLWKKVMYGLSAGRVQSVAVRLVVERERERQAFTPEEYWGVLGEFQNGSKKKIWAELSEIKGKKVAIKNGEQAEKIKAEALKGIYSVVSLKKSERKKNPYPPFKTSTLQQAMANIYGFNAKKTMRAAQGLFEKGYITYHRTDSLSLSPQFINEARGLIKKRFGEAYLPDTPNLYKTKSANAQEAHEAIRPTLASRVPEKSIGLAGDEFKTYSIVWLRSLECQMNPSIYEQTSLSIGSDDGYIFKASGSVVLFEGWLAVAKMLGVREDEEETPSILPELAEGTKMKLLEIKNEQHFTQPPARYNDASLIKKMEELGVGRPSTYAPTLSTIQDRKYVLREGRYFYPNDVAYVVVDLLVAHFPEIVDYNFTALMEESLDKVAEGEIQWVPVIREFYKPFEKKIGEKDKELNKRDVTNLGESEEKCPECGRVLVFKLGKFGKFLSCSGYPECKYAKPLEPLNGAGGEDEDFGKCDKCEDGVMVLKQGRFGKFLACSNYPKCKNTKPYLDKIGMKCPKCGEGEVVKKKAKWKEFYGCSRYPDCDWKSWKSPMVTTGSAGDGEKDGDTRGEVESVDSIA